MLALPHFLGKVAVYKARQDCFPETLGRLPSMGRSTINPRFLKASAITTAVMPLEMLRLKRLPPDVIWTRIYELVFPSFLSGHSKMHGFFRSSSVTLSTTTTN